MHDRVVVLSLAGIVALAACTDAVPTSPAVASAPHFSLIGARSGPTYILTFSKGKGIPADADALVRAAGGTIVATIPELAAALVSTANPDFRVKGAGITGVSAVLPNVQARWIDPHPSAQALEATFNNPPASGDNDTYFDLEWGMAAINAPAAWNTGARGAGARVAVLDAGIDADQPDFDPRFGGHLNSALSTSFIPGEGFNVRPGAFFNHGTHVAGIIGAADNGFGVIGVAPEAELVAVKVLSEFTGSGSFFALAQGLVYAASIHADIANMSLGASFPRHGFISDNGTPDDPTDDVPVSASENSALITFVGDAATFAYQHGVTLIAAAGNEGRDRNHDADVIELPADLPHVIQIAATTPVGWALDPSTNLDVPASYTNFGSSRINFAAPGGDVQLTTTDRCVVAVFLSFCANFDLVLSDGTGDFPSYSFIWAGGTSMASPHAAGVAALIVGKHGGSMQPSAVEAALRASADDIGTPGKDDFSGQGRVDALRAVE
jgi:subtilisin family serine protease